MQIGTSDIESVDICDSMSFSVMAGGKVRVVDLSFNHPICFRQHVRRNRESDLLSGFQIEHCDLLT